MSRAHWLPVLLLVGASAAQYAGSSPSEGPPRPARHHTFRTHRETPDSSVSAQSEASAPAAVALPQNGQERAAPAQDAGQQPMHPLYERAQLQDQARSLERARSLLETWDLEQAQQLLGEADLLGDELMSRPDREALRVAISCAAYDSKETRAAAHRFLRDVHGSLLRKLVRRLCFAA